MEFNKWVLSEGGPAQVARRLDVTPHRLRHWCRGTSVPRFDVMVRIVKLSRGKIKLEQLHLLKTKKKK